MWRKTLHDSENLYFNERLEVVGDYEFWLKAAECHQFKKIPKLLGLYYRSPQQTNKEFSDRHLSNQESFSVRREAILRRLSQAGQGTLGTHLATCSQDIQSLLNSIKSDGFSANAARKLQHLYWTASSLLEFTGQFDAAKSVARDYFDIINDGFLLSYQLKELIMSKTTPSRDKSDQLVSVIIPTFNAAAYIEETILSVHAQSHQNIEIICVDDGSSDITVQKIQTLSENLPDIPIKLILQHNQGPSRARNRAIQMAKGDFILPLDADDQIAPNYIAKTLDAFRNESNISVVFTEAVFYGTENKIWATEDIRLPELFSRNFLNVTALFKKSAWRDAGGYDEKLPGYEDWDLWITMASKGYRFKLIPEPLFFYRFRTNSRAANSEHKDAQKRMAIMRKHKDIYRFPNNENRHLLGQFKRIAPQLIHPDWAYRTGLTTNENTSALRTASHSGNTKIRILFVCHDFPPHIYAGAQLYALNLAKTLNASGKAEVDVIYPEFWNDSTTCKLIQDNFEGVRVFRLIKDHTHAFAPSVRHPQVIEILDAFFHKNSYDVVHIHELGQMSAAPIEIAKRHNLPCIMTLHTTWLLCFYWFLTTPDQNCCSGPESIQKCTACFMKFHNFKNERDEMERVVTQFMEFRMKYLKKMFSILDLRIAPSRYMKEIYERFGFKNVQVRPLGMVAVNVPPKVEHPELRFGFIGQVSKRKGVNVLIDAFSQIAQKFPKVQLRIHGNQKDESFASMIWDKTKHLSGVRYFGPYTHHEIGKIMSEIDVLIVPSYWENYPLVVQEALQHKVPVIASRIAGFPEMIHDGKNGFLFEVGNAKDLALKILKLCENPSMVAQLKENIDQVRDIIRDRDDYLKDYEKLMQETLPQPCGQ
jgi:glycosyltransferase involved in cell wall biosynthesis